MLTVNSFFIPPTHIPFHPEMFFVSGFEVCCLTFCPFFHSTDVSWYYENKDRTCCGILFYLPFSVFQQTFYQNLWVRKESVIYNSSSFHGLVKDVYDLLDCTFWSQKMCCLLPAEGKGWSMVVASVFPEFSRKHSAVTVWEASNLFTEGFVFAHCLHIAFFGGLHFLFQFGFLESLLGCAESGHRTFLSFCVTRQWHVSPSQ